MKIEKSYSIPVWVIMVVAILAVIAIVASCSYGYNAYKEHENNLLLEGAQIGYNQALINIINMVTRDGFVQITINDDSGIPQSIYLVPQAING